LRLQVNHMFKMRGQAGTLSDDRQLMDPSFRF
jgi:hypothetical protein